MNQGHLVIGGFVVTIGIISFYEIKNCNALPWPPRIVATGLTFGMLDLFSIISPELAGVMTVGIVLAAIVNKGFNTNASCDHTEATVRPTSSFQPIQGGVSNGVVAGGQAAINQNIGVTPPPGITSSGPIVNT